MCVQWGVPYRVIAEDGFTKRARTVEFRLDISWKKSVAFNNLRTIFDSFKEIDVEQLRTLYIDRGYLSPGYMVVIATIGNYRGYSFQNLDFAEPSAQAGYARNIRLQEHLDGYDSYEYGRINAGRTYSPLVRLDSEEETDEATSTLVSCLGHILGLEDLPKGVNELCHVIGELLGNVWAHGMSTGFSMAQKFTPMNKDYIEFAVSDHGGGFLRELESCGIQGVNSDQEAIEWCIQEGNSTKLRTDEWSQRVPGDHIGGNPFGSHVNTHHNENHHQGLGLYKLIELVRRYKGTLTLWSGDALLEVSNSGNFSYSVTEDGSRWEGVSISCGFFAEELLKEDRDEVDESVLQLMGHIGRVDDE